MKQQSLETVERERERERERAIVYTTWHLHYQARSSTKQFTQEKLASSKKLGFVVVQKIYIKYKNFKDGLCSKIVCPFCVQKEVIDTG